MSHHSDDTARPRHPVESFLCAALASLEGLVEAVVSWEPTRAALARGEIHAEQAQAIADRVDLLDTDEAGVTAHDKQRAEAFLLARAAGHDADALGRLGLAIYRHLDPEGADAREAEALARAEARARRRTRLRIWDDGEGMTHGSFAIPTWPSCPRSAGSTPPSSRSATPSSSGAGSRPHVWTPGRGSATWSGCGWPARRVWSRCG